MSPYKDRRLAFDPKDHLLSHIKYPWAIEVYERMEADTRFRKLIPADWDNNCYRNKLTPEQRSAYDKALTAVSNQSGMQFNIIRDFGQFVTAPEVSLMLARQMSQKGAHVRACQAMVEAIRLIPYNICPAKNEHIMRRADALHQGPNPASFALAIVGNLLLEGVHCYSAFLVFCALARNGKMLASADVVRGIQRDVSGTHLAGFAHMHHAYAQEVPGVYAPAFWDDAEELFREAVELEIALGQHIIQGGLNGLTPQMVEQFIKWLANERWLLIKPGQPLYPGVTNPVPWFLERERIVTSFL